MAAPLGHPRYGGRKAGTSNKKTQALRENIEKRLGGTIEDSMLDIYEQSESKGIKLSILRDLMQYVYPRLKPLEILEEDDEAKTEQAKELLKLDDKQLADAMRERLKALTSENE